MITLITAAGRVTGTLSSHSIVRKDHILHGKLSSKKLDGYGWIRSKCTSSGRKRTEVGGGKRSNGIVEAPRYVVYLMCTKMSFANFELREHM